MCERREHVMDIPFFNTHDPHGNGVVQDIDDRPERPPAGGANRKRRWRPRKRKQSEADADGPWFSKLKRDNRKRARQHFGGGGHPGSQQMKHTGLRRKPIPKGTWTPVSRNQHYGRAHRNGRPSLLHSVTPNAFQPGEAWKNGYGSLAQEEAQAALEVGFNFFGSNAALLERGIGPELNANADNHAVDEDGECASREETSVDAAYVDETNKAGTDDDDDRPEREQLRRQALYIAELEDENMNLRERLYLARQTIAEVAPGICANIDDASAVGDDDANLTDASVMDPNVADHASISARLLQVLDLTTTHLPPSTRLQTHEAPLGCRGGSEGAQLCKTAVTALHKQAHDVRVPSDPAPPIKETVSTATCSAPVKGLHVANLTDRNEQSHCNAGGLGLAHTVSDGASKEIMFASDMQLAPSAGAHAVMDEASRDLQHLELHCKSGVSDCSAALLGGVTDMLHDASPTIPGSDTATGISASVDGSLQTPNDQDCHKRRCVAATRG